MKNDSASDINIKKNGGKVELSIASQLNIHNIKDVYSEIKKKLNKINDVTLILSGITHMDISGIQLLKSLENHCRDNKISFDKKISITDPELLNLLNKTGFNSLSIS